MQTVLITGTNRGIGFALTRHYLARDARVFATCRDLQRVQALLNLQEIYQDHLTIVPLDVTDEAQLERAFQRISDEAIPGVIDFVEQLNKEHDGHGFRSDGSTFF